MIDRIIEKNKQEKQVGKKMQNFVPELSENIKVKLQSIATKGHGTNIQPKVITLEEIKKAFNEWKLENQIFNSDLTLAHCRDLSLSFQKILQIANLESLVRLEKLKLDNNMIMKIENLDTLTNLKWLDLSFNSISKMEGLNKLENLQDLSLYCNQITEVGGLDNCRMLHVLSVGMNQIKNCKEMVSYLRKFLNLQALNVADNPFAKDDANQQLSFEQQMQQKSIVYPASYDPILANLDKLIYLDWKPIDLDKKLNAIDANKSNNQKDKSDQQYLNELRQQELMKDYMKFKHANIEATIDFYPNFIKKLKDDLEINASGQETWDKFHKLNNFSESMDTLNKNVDSSIKAYRENVLKMIEDRDAMEKCRLRELDDGHEKFVAESKALVSSFKRLFKSLTLGVPAAQINSVKIEAEIKELEGKLMEIQVWEKQVIAARLEEFRKDYKSFNEKIIEETGALKNGLEEHKKELKESLTTIKQEFDKKWEAYQNDEINDKDKEEEFEVMQKIAEDESIWIEIEKINETYEDKIGNLKDTLETATNNAYGDYFKLLSEKEFARSKKRIGDIREISDMYTERLIICLGADVKKK